MPIVTAIARPHGATVKVDQQISSRMIDEDLQGDIIGECVTEVINAAYKAGQDPVTHKAFIVLVSFQ